MHSVEPDMGLELTTHETRPELRLSRTFNQLSLSGAPLWLNFH